MKKKDLGDTIMEIKNEYAVVIPKIFTIKKYI